MTKREPNPYCFHKSVVDRMEQYIYSDMYNKLVANVDVHYTQDDFLHLCVNEEDFAFVKKVRERYHRARFFITELQVNYKSGKFIFNYGNIDNFYPDSLSHQNFTENINKEGNPYAKPFIEYMDALENIYVSLVDLRLVLNYLCKVFKRPKELRFVWPPILVLLKETGQTELAEKLLVGACPAEIPVFDPNTKAMIDRSIVTMLGYQFIDQHDKPLGRLKKPNANVIIIRK